MKQDRFKSKYLWVAVGALIAFFLGNYGLYETIGLTAETFQTLLNLVFTLLIALGIINSPTDADKL